MAVKGQSEQAIASARTLDPPVEEEPGGAHCARARPHRSYLDDSLSGMLASWTWRPTDPPDDQAWGGAVACAAVDMKMVRKG